ncbi:MAG TPA: DUF4158 domain-containing protein [Bryobacteraceae bacterium]|nr:DUF4158 domain-containing protein [Bryobacteraceae bacterium]
MDPASADVYAARDTTRRQHLSALQREYGFSAYHRDTEQQLAAWLLPVALRREAPWFLVTSVVERLREQRVVLPAMSTLESLVIKVRRRAEESIFLTLTQSLSPEQRNALDVLLYQETDRAKGVANLRRPPGAAIPASILDLMDRIDLIRAVGLRSDLDQSLSPGRLRRLSSRAARHTLQHLREYAPMKRHALVVALLLQTGQDFTDETMDMQARLIGRLFNRAERQETELQQENPSIRQQLRQYTKLGKALLSARAKNQAWNKLWKPAQDGITWHRASQRQSASPIPLAPASSTCVRIGHRSGNTVLAF